MQNDSIDRATRPSAPVAPGPLFLRFHGRVLEHLGIQMYQSPVNAIAEMVANAWDADARRVSIDLPSKLEDGANIVIHDDGLGMTRDECQELYLHVGRDRRGGNPEERTPSGRPVMGRKGIGKFAGFGIAEVIRVDTISSKTGERTVFEMDVKELMADEYVGTAGKRIDVIRYEGPEPTRREKHGTTIVLSRLKLSRTISPGRFARSMSRRFLLHQAQADFEVRVNGDRLPESFELAKVEYAFPEAYADEEWPEGLVVDEEGWGIEEVDGERIRWRFLFHQDTIDEEELRGIAVYANKKLAQKPFLFNVTGGLQGQHGVEYLSGQVEADFIDSLPEDLIATERQRINWEHERTQPLLAWGQRRLRELLGLWARRRREQRVRELEDKVAGFGSRLDRLPNHEKKTVHRALTQLASISTLTHKQFKQLGEAVLTTWEQGRLRDLIAEIAEADDLAEGELLRLLVEANVLTALNTAEAVKTKLLTVKRLRDRIERRELELAVRDFIADNAWLIDPEWETFRKERTVGKLLEDAAGEAGLTGEGYRGRVDLAMASGRHLLILEFVRPGQKVDWDHLSRFKRYVRNIRRRVRANTGGRFQRVTGYLVADKLDVDPALQDEIEEMQNDDMFAMEWNELLARAASRWRDFLHVLGMRADDFRLKALIEDEADWADESAEGVETAPASSQGA